MNDSEGNSATHHQSGVLFKELTPDSAETQNMVIITHQTAKDEAPRPVYSGVYHDDWHKTDHGWQIARRVFYVDRFIRSSMI